MKRFALVIIAVILAVPAFPQQAPSPPPSRGEFIYLVIQAVQDIDDLSPSSPELEWQLSRIQARKSATELIRGAQNQQEFSIAGDAWDYLQNKITLRIEAQAGSNMASSRADADRHRSLALSRSGIDPSRLYPHSVVN